MEWAVPASLLLPLMIDALEETLTELEALRRELAERNVPRASWTPATPTPMRVQHVGEIVKWLREKGRLTRQQLRRQTGLTDSTIRNVEMGRHRPTHTTWRKLLRAACMATLPERAKELGVSLDCAPPL